MPFAFTPLLKAQGLVLVVQSITATIQALVEHTRSHAIEFWRAFPFSPIGMLDAAIGFFTGITGVIISVPFTVYESLFLDWLKENRLGSKLMRVDDAIRIPFDAMREIFQLVTFSGDSSFWGYIAGGIASWIYRTFKRVKFIGQLIKAKNEAEFIEVIVNSYRKKFRLLKILGVVLGIVSLGLFATLYFMFYGLIFSSPRWTGYILAQDSKRVRVKRKNVQIRVNARRGFDQP